MIQTTGCKPAAATLWSPSWQTMLRGDLAGHAFLLFELQYRGTRRAVHTCWSECDEYVLTFSLTAVFMISFHIILPPTHTLLLPCDFWSCSQSIFARGLFLISCWSNTHSHTHIYKHTYKHMHAAAFSDQWLLRKPQCTTSLFNQSYPSFCVYFHHNSWSHYLFLLQICIIQLMFTLSESLFFKSRKHISMSWVFACVRACVCVCMANDVVKLVRERAEQRTVLTIGTTCTPLWEAPESCQSINI